MSAPTIVFTQQRCPKDGTLGILLSIEKTIDFVSPILSKWMCQKCHDTFIVRTSYFEVIDYDSE